MAAEAEPIDSAHDSEQPDDADFVDLLDDEPLESTEIDLVHSNITSIPHLQLQRFTKLQKLCLRQNRIKRIVLPDVFSKTLHDLDLYDNAITHIDGLESLAEITSLDLSFNNIRHIKNVDHLTKLRDLYFVQNKIEKIQGLETLKELKNLELGANRIREIESLETLTQLEALWLGKNKLTEMKGLETLTKLQILSIQSNRLTTFAGLPPLQDLSELHISHNAISSLESLPILPSLTVLDISRNPIRSLKGIGKKLPKLEELWASNCDLHDFSEVERELFHSKTLTTVYFEGNPLQKMQPATYRHKVRLVLPRIKQIDATFVKM